MSKYILIFILTILVTSCGGDGEFWDTSCESEMSDVKAKLGEPEEITNYSSSGYSSTKWWYWSRGVEHTFTYTNSCDVSTYTFTPIR